MEKKSIIFTRNRLLSAASLITLTILLSFAFNIHRGGREAEKARPDAGVSATQVKDAANGLAGLPLAARYAISEGIGRDNAGFHAKATADGFETTNPMKKPERALRAGFNKKGIEVRASASRWQLSLSGYGYGDTIAPAQPAQLEAMENRIEFKRGPLTEWYVNGPLGLQQGFTIAAPPDKSSTGPLTLALATNDGMRAMVSNGGRSLTIKNESGAELHYTGLMAYDANKRELPVWLEANNNQALIRVDDSLAEYPIVVDPLIQLAKLTASDGGGGVAGSDPAGDQFGISVAIYDDTSMADQDVIVVGAWLEETPDVTPGNRGAAYVFVKQMGTWANMTETVKLLPSDPEDRARFGSSVAISGDTIAVGALREDNATVGDDRGAVYVFVRPAMGWGSTGPTQTSTAKLTSSATNNGALLGSSVDISGDTIVAGAPGDSTGGSSRGAVYVFVRPMSGWVSGTQTAKLTASDAANFDTLGTSVAIDGDTIVAGAPDNDADNGNSGAVYLYEEPMSGWANGTQTAKLIMTAAESQTNDRMGISVDISGDTVVAGAHQIANPGGAVVGPGKAIVFVEPMGGWTGTVTHAAKLVASDAVNGDQFGRGVSIDDANIVVGAPGKNTATGKGYLFTEPAMGWAGTLTESDTMTASDGQPGDNFGFSIAIDNGFIVVGAWGDDIPDTPNEDQGSAYVFQATPQADLSVTKTDSPDPVVAGTDLTYTITVSNAGPNDAQNVVLTDTIPAGTTFVSFTTPAGWTPTTPNVGGTGTVTASRSTLTTTDGAQVFTLVVKVNASTLDGSTITNTASVSSDTDDPDAMNDSDTETTSVEAQADLSISKSDSPDPVRAGSNITYIITVSNGGPSDAQNVTVSDAIPAGTTLVSAMQTLGPMFNPASGGGSVSWSRSTFAAGASATFELVVNVNCAAAHNSTISNTATVTSTTTDNDSADKMDTELTTVSNPAPIFDTPCPAPITAVTPQTCPTATGTAVTFPTPTASDQSNCPVSVVCSPASGSTFPIGTTTVTCTATDAANQTAQCSFTVTVFNGCLQDDSNPGNVVLFNTVTGEYRFCCNGVVIKAGVGTVTRQGCNYTISHNTSDRRVAIQVSFTTKNGSASIQAPAGTIRCRITDRDITNNACNCAAPVAKG